MEIMRHYQLRTANGRWFSSAAEKWETQVTKYESESKEMIDDHSRLGIVKDIPPESSRPICD